MSRTSVRKKTIQARPNTKGRIALNKRTKGKRMSSFIVLEQPGNKFLLEPVIEVSNRKSWFIKNK